MCLLYNCIFKTWITHLYCAKHSTKDYYLIHSILNVKTLICLHFVMFFLPSKISNFTSMSSFSHIPHFSVKLSHQHLYITQSSIIFLLYQFFFQKCLLRKVIQRNRRCQILVSLHKYKKQSSRGKSIPTSRKFLFVRAQSEKKEEV